MADIDGGNSSVGEACDGPAACVAAAGGRELFTVGPEPSLPLAQPLPSGCGGALACLASAGVDVESIFSVSPPSLAASACPYHGRSPYQSTRRLVSIAPSAERGASMLATRRSSP